MDRPPSYPHYQSPNPNFFHRAPPPLNPNPNFFHRPPPPPPPLQTPNTYSIAPSPPPIRELSDTLSSLQSLISACQRTLDSLSQNLSLDHSSPLHKDGFVRCPFDPNHLMPLEALFLHSLRCPNPLVFTSLLGSFSSYRNTLELPCESELNCDLCFSLDDVTDFGNNFFYNDCPGAVNFSELDGKTRRFTLPSVLLSVECSEFEGSSVLEKSLRLLPSDVCVIKCEIGGWRDYPSFYSFSVLSSIIGSEAVEMSELRTWILVNSTRYGVIIDTYMSDHVFLLFRLSLKAVVKEASGFMMEYDANAAGEQSV